MRCYSHFHDLTSERSAARMSPAHVSRFHSHFYLSDVEIYQGSHHGNLRKAFIRRVYGLLSCQLLLNVLIVAVCMYQPWVRFVNSSVGPGMHPVPPPPPNVSNPSQGGRDQNFGTMQAGHGHKPALRTDYARKAVGQARLERKWRLHT